MRDVLRHPKDGVREGIRNSTAHPARQALHYCFFLTGWMVFLFRRSISSSIFHFESASRLFWGWCGEWNVRGTSRKHITSKKKKKTLKIAPNLPL